MDRKLVSDSVGRHACVGKKNGLHRRMDSLDVVDKFRLCGQVRHPCNPPNALTPKGNQEDLKTMGHNVQAIALGASWQESV